MIALVHISSWSLLVDEEAVEAISIDCSGAPERPFRDGCPWASGPPQDLVFRTILALTLTLVALRYR